MLSWAIALLAAAATPAPAPVLRVGLDPRSAPWAFVPGRDDSAQDFRAHPRLRREELARLAGLDVDVARALGRLTNRRVEFVQTRWIDLEHDLVAGRYDVILNAWTPTPRTPSAIAASDPYYSWGLLLAVRGDEASIQSPADLAGRRIGHISDPSVLVALRAMGHDLDARLVADDQGGEALFADLAARRVDAVAFDSTFVRWRVARDRRFRIVGEPLNRLGYHVGVRRQDAALVEAVRDAVRRIVASPEAREIRERWEGAGAPRP